MKRAKYGTLGRFGLNVLKHKVIYITGYVVRDYRPAVESEDKMSKKFVKELDCGELSMPTIAIVFFVHYSIYLLEKAQETKNTALWKFYGQTFF